MDAEKQELIAQNARLRARIGELEAHVEKLAAALEEARRAGKRQAAPFRKKSPKAKPKKPGRKSGEDHGRHAHRAVPERIDETHEAPLPESCPHCNARDLREVEVVPQYQSEIETRLVHRQFNVHVGCCQACGARVQGRQQLQTSDALGAAGRQLGAQVHALLAVLNKQLGLSHGKCRSLLETAFGLKIARSTSGRSILRTAQRCERAHEEIRLAVRGSPQVTPDETGWRVGGKNAWLHVLVGRDATYYEIGRRGHEVAQRVLGIDFSGVLVHDGWSPYDRFLAATHQQCNAHALRRAHDLLETALGPARQFPRAVRDLFRDALAWRDRYRDRVLQRSRERAYQRYTASLERLVARDKTDVANQRFTKHLRKHLYAWFWYLNGPTVDATNWRAEQAIRPAVVNRKVWGGNRTWIGARAQTMLTSVLTTCRQRTHNSLDYLIHTLQSPTQIPLPAER